MKIKLKESTTAKQLIDVCGVCTNQSVDFLLSGDIFDVKEVRREGKNHEGRHCFYLKVPWAPDTKNSTFTLFVYGEFVEVVEPKEKSEDSWYHYWLNNEWMK